LRLHPVKPLHRDIDRNSLTGITAVVQVVAVVHIVDVDVVVVVPVIPPVRRPWINRTDPITFVLEAWIPTHYQERKALDAEPMIRPEVSPVAVVRNAIAAVATALLPGAMIGLPVL
jgi:hypothetical protein